MGVLWKTMPGRLKQVPQDSMEWNEIEQIRGIVLTDSLTRVILMTHVLNPLVISYEKYIYWKYFMRFIRV